MPPERLSKKFAAAARRQPPTRTSAVSKANQRHNEPRAPARRLTIMCPQTPRRTTPRARNHQAVVTKNEPSESEQLGRDNGDLGESPHTYKRPPARPGGCQQHAIAEQHDDGHADYPTRRQHCCCDNHPRWQRRVAPVCHEDGRVDVTHSHGENVPQKVECQDRAKDADSLIERPRVFKNFPDRRTIKNGDPSQPSPETHAYAPGLAPRMAAWIQTTTI